MRRSPRLRKFAKWTGLVLSVLLLTIWVVSGWYVAVARREPGAGWYLLDIHGGLFAAWYSNESFLPTNEVPFRFHRLAEPQMFWSFNYDTKRSRTGTTSIVSVPIWCFQLPLTASSAWLWRRDRRLSKPGLCKQCNYDLRGIEKDKACPECGVKN
jgi:hypothetical protein